MTPQRAKELLPIIQAFAEGRELQCCDPNGIHNWMPAGEPTFRDGVLYRIKPEPAWRPWTMTEGPSFFIAVTKFDERQNFPWFACRKVANGNYRVGADPVKNFLTNEDLFNHYWMVGEDGKETVCGILETP